MEARSAGRLIKEFNARAQSAGLRVEVLGAGNFDAEIAIVAEAPGETEARMKMPLVGGSGRFLWDSLRKFNINRQQCWVTNAVKKQLVFKKKETKLPITRNELDHWAGLLKWELSQLPNLKYILVLGNVALTALTGEEGITNWRGSVTDVILPNGRVVKAGIAFNPAHVMREGRWESMFMLDLGKFDMVLRGVFKPYIITPIINPSLKEAMEFIDEMEHGGEVISYDIESIAGETACIGLANDDHTGMCINFRTQSDNIFSLEDEIALRLRFARLFQNPNCKFVAQNGNFDSYFLWYRDRIYVQPNYMDTLLAHHTLYPTLPHSLAFLTSQYTTHPYYKDEGKDWKEAGNINQFWEYNVKDACLTRYIHKKLEKELREQKLDKFFFSHVMRLQPHLVGMTVHGVSVDTSLKDTISTKLGEDVEAVRQEFYKAVQIATGMEGYCPNPSSPKQMKKLYFEHLRLVGRGTSTNAENRNRMISHPNTPSAAKDVLRLVDRYAEEHKFLSTYAEAKIDEDGRIRCEYKQFGVQSAPGRLSSAQTMWGSGMNMQNQPERAKEMYIAPKGFRYIYFDLAQAEARVVAMEANIESWKIQFERARLEGGYDCHRALASEMFDIPYDETPTEDRTPDGKPTLRFVAKRCRHGLNYRMMADRLATVTGLPINVAVDAFNKYHRITPELKQWWRDVEKEVRKTKELWSCMGRRLRFIGRLPPPGISSDASVMDSIIAFKPQSAIGDKVSECIYLCHDDPDWDTNEARIVLNVHDALIGICPDDDEVATHYLRIMKKHAEKPLFIRGEQLIIPADCAWSIADERGVHRWSNLKKLKGF